MSESEGGREEREREKRERESSAACFQLLCKETCNVSVSMACKEGKTTRAQPAVHACTVSMYTRAQRVYIDRCTRVYTLWIVGAVAVCTVAR